MERMRPPTFRFEAGRYEARAVLLEAYQRVDGDTFHALIRLTPLGEAVSGFDLAVRWPVRIRGIDAPERGTPEGDAATVFLASWLRDAQRDGGDWPLLLRWSGRLADDRYHRVLAEVTANGRDLARVLLDAGHAREWTKERPTTGPEAREKA